MREVKEKSPLKERVGETLKSAPRTAFRRGTDASFQQLRQELHEAAQDGQPEDRYESGKITDTADHAVQEARHLAEKAVHKLPKTKSEPQPDYPPQSQPQVSRSVRESASSIREKPVSPASDKQPTCVPPVASVNQPRNSAFLRVGSVGSASFSPYV